MLSIKVASLTMYTCTQTVQCCNHSLMIVNAWVEVCETSVRGNKVNSTPPKKRQRTRHPWGQQNWVAVRMAMRFQDMDDDHSQVAAMTNMIARMKRGRTHDANLLPTLSRKVMANTVDWMLPMTRRRGRGQQNNKNHSEGYVQYTSFFCRTDGSTFHRIS